MKAMRESKMETSLKATLEEVNQGFESEYNLLLRLSQTMTSNGLVGEKYDAYRTAEEQYDKILEYQDFYQTLNVATWEMEDVMLGAYLIQGESREMTPEILFSTYSTKKETFQPETLSKLVDTGEVTYHSIHQSYNSVRNDNVVSMGRRTSFSDGTDAWIYLEAKSAEDRADCCMQIPLKQFSSGNILFSFLASPFFLHPPSAHSFLNVFHKTKPH